MAKKTKGGQKDGHRATIFNTPEVECRKCEKYQQGQLSPLIGICLKGDTPIYCNRLTKCVFFEEKKINISQPIATTLF